MTNKIEKRFIELKNQAEEVANSKVTHLNMRNSNTYVDPEKLLGWITKTENLISSVCGKDSTYYATFVEAKSAHGFETNLAIFNRLFAIFSAIKDDYENGYLKSYIPVIIEKA